MARARWKGVTMLRGLDRHRRALGCLLCAAAVALTAAPAAATAAAEMEISSFDASLSDYQASGHPDADVSFRLATEPAPDPGIGTGEQCKDEFEDPIQCQRLKGGPARDIEVALPAGLYGNPQAIQFCDLDALSQDACPPSTQVGYQTLRLMSSGSPDGAGFTAFGVEEPVFNVRPERGEIAKLGFRVLGAVNTAISVRLGNDGEYRVVTDVPSVFTGAPVVGTDLEIWGSPYDTSHDDDRQCPNQAPSCGAGAAPAPFLVAPASCGRSARLEMRVRSWLQPADWVAAASTPRDVIGCERLSFEPEMSLKPTVSAADAPTGLNVSLDLPQRFDDPAGLETPPLRDVAVTLPEGMAVSPASAAGLSACSMPQLGISPAGVPNGDPTACPLASKIGTVSAVTPVLAEALEGGIYLAEQRRNPFGSMLALYLTLESEARGLLIKLAGKVEADPSTGRLTVTFEDNPQLPVESLELSFKSGPRSPLSTPTACGTHTSSYEITSWAGHLERGSSSFGITSGPNGQPCPDGRFAPELEAGTANPVAGRHSSFALRVTREDGTERLSTIHTTLPKGLLGKLAGIPYCPDAALSGISAADGTGAAQLVSPSCPAESQVGTVTIGAGAGPSPFYTDTGRAYLAGPHKGAPLSIAFVTPALAGPFDLGSVVVRAALQVNPATAEITAASDPLPSILHGIPLDLKDVRVNLDRANFTLNPTSCDPMEFTGSATSTAGRSAPLSERFQVAGCDRLKFKPKLALKLIGPTRRASHPKLRATLTMPKQGGANIRRAVVTMPKTQFLENAHIRTICTRVQWAAKSCPKAAIYGYAKAWTPLLDRSLEGPVYLRSSNNPLPDLVADLDGQIEIDLVGRIDAVNERLRTTFASVPDAPVTRFVLNMQGGKKGLLVNNTNLCRAKPRANVRFTGQNGKAFAAKPSVKTSCKGKKKR